MQVRHNPRNTRPSYARKKNARNRREAAERCRTSRAAGMAYGRVTSSVAWSSRLTRLCQIATKGLAM